MEQARRSDSSPVSGKQPPFVCIAEDRSSCEPALRILVASLARNSPDVRAHLFCPNATPDFEAWIKAYPNASLNQFKINKEWRKYDIKPAAMLALMDAGYGDIVWIDSDILAAGDIRPVMAQLDDKTIAVAEEALIPGRVDNDGMRTRMWGFKVGRTLPFVANTGVIRVTSHHRRFLERWMELLETDEYKAMQDLDWSLRPAHMLGDQDVFSSLLCSEEFAQIPLKIFRRGTDIIQFLGLHGYTTGERLGSLVRGLPPLIHSQGYRPWWPRAAEHSTQDRIKALYNDLSPYTMVARRYRAVLADTAWLEPPSFWAKVFVTCAAGSAPLLGLPMAVVNDIFRGVRRLIGKW